MAAAADSFLGVTDRKRFIYLASGLMGQKATEHGEYLIERLTESPLQKADGTTRRSDSNGTENNAGRIIRIIS